MDYITIVRADEPINKKFLLKDGKVEKGNAPRAQQGIAQTIHVPDQLEMLKVLQSISDDPNAMLILGYIPDMLPVATAQEGQEFIIMDEYLIKGRAEVDGMPVYPRLKRVLHQSTWFLFDHDQVAEMPRDLRYQSIEETMEGFQELIPSLDGYIVQRSNSSRVLHKGEPYMETERRRGDNGGEMVPKPNNNLHIYIQAKDGSDIERFGKALLAYATTAGFGFLRNKHSRKTGEVIAKQAWSIFDPTVFSRERLVYDGKPTVKGRGLTVRDADIIVQNGKCLDTSVVENPGTDMIKAFKERTGISISYDGRHGMYYQQDIPLSAVIDTTEAGEMTLQEYWLSAHDKMRCQSPFRDSHSEAAFLNRHRNGSPFCWDAGIKYIPTKRPPVHQFVKAIKDIDVKHWGEGLFMRFMYQIGLEENEVKRESALQELKKHSDGKVTIQTLRRAMKQAINEAKSGSSKDTRWIEELNKEYAIVRMGADTRVAYRQYDNGSIRFLKTTAFTTEMNNQSDPSGEPLGTSWMKHSLRRTYKHVSFLPEVSFADECKAFPEGDVLNLWTGYKCRPVKGKWVLIKKHLLDVWCGGHFENLEWLLNYYAYMFQHPDEAGRVFIGLNSLPGAGKGIILAYLIIERMIGKVHAIRLTQPKHLTGAFNAHMIGKIFAFADETTFGGNKVEAGALKGMIDDDQMYERKGIDAEFGSNHLTVNLASNEDYMAHIDIGDRRMGILPVSDKYANNRKYFDALKKEIDNGGDAAFMYELLNRDVSNYDPFSLPPIQSEIRQTLQIKSAPPMIQFIQDLIDSEDPASINDNTLDKAFLGYIGADDEKYPAGLIGQHHHEQIVIPTAQIAIPREEAYVDADEVNWENMYAVFDKGRFYEAFKYRYGNKYNGASVFYRELRATRWNGLTKYMRSIWPGKSGQTQVVILPPLPELRVLLNNKLNGGKR